MLAVKLEYQGKSLSSKLIHKAESFVKEQGCTKMALSVVSVRPNLLNFYGKFGYKQTGTFKIVFHAFIKQDQHLSLLKSALTAL